MTPTQEAFSAIVTALKHLGPALSVATAVQHEGPPGGARSSDTEGRGIKNPTLDIVLDPRRVAVSDAVAATTTALRQAHDLLHPHTETLHAAVARWEGKDGPQ